MLHQQGYQEDIIDTRLECGRKIYNALLNVVLKRYNEMKKTIFTMDNNYTKQLNQDDLEKVKKVLIELSDILKKGDNNENI